MPDNDTKLLNRFRKDLDPEEKRYTFGSQLCDDPVILETFDKKTGLKLAVKQHVLDIQTEEQRKEVQREVLSLEKIANDHVIRMHKHVLVRGEKTLYQFMDLFRETPLQRFVEELPSEEAHFDTYLELTRQVLEGLAAIHKAAVIHRDLKPANIFVGQKEKTLDVRIMDFGLSVPPYTPYSKTYGTPGYTDPSIKTGSRATTRADIFSLGVILYDLYAGNLRKGRTIGAESLSKKIAEAVKKGDQEAAEKICKVAPETLQDTPAKYRKPLAAIIEKCLRNLELARYANVSTIQLDFYLLTSPEKQQPIFDALKQNAILGISNAAEAYNACVPLQFRENALASVMLNDVHVGVLSKIKTCGISALLPYIRMLQETNRFEQEKDALKTLTSEPLENLLAFVPKAEPAANWLKALESLTPAGKELWGQLTTQFNIPLDKLTTLLQETADYETKSSAEACYARALKLSETNVQNLTTEQKVSILEQAEQELVNALKRNPNHTEAKKALCPVLVELADHYGVTDKKRAEAKAKHALTLATSAEARSKLYYVLENTAETTEESFAILNLAVADPRLRASEEELTRTKGRLVQCALIMKDCPELTSICQDYVKTVSITSDKAQMHYAIFQAQTLARAHHHLKNWGEAVKYAGLTLGAFANGSLSGVEYILEDSLRQLKLDELVEKMKQSYSIDIRPILDVPLVNCGVDRTAEQMTKDVGVMSMAFGKACKGMPQEALDMLVTELRTQDYQRSEYLAGHTARSVKSLHHPEHFMLPARAQKRRIYLTGALIGAAVVSGAFGLAKGLHIWPFNQPATYQQK